jgi:purine nucleosidase
MTWEADGIRPRSRVISDNDYSGDPDGLVQLAHHLLSPSVDLRLVVGSRQAAVKLGTDEPDTTAADSAVAAHRVAELAGRADVPIVTGAGHPLRDRTTPAASGATKAIVTEALREDTDLPLFVTCGGGLTDIASAWLVEPGIAERLTLVWIGGGEHEDLAITPESAGLEYNTQIDLLAAQVVFNDSDLRVWQVPRDAYVQVLASRAEMLTRMRPHGPLGAHLYDALGHTSELWGLGETYVLGDSPLVLLTALVSNFTPIPSSSRWVDRPRPRLTDSGGYEANPDGPPLRIFTHLDTRVLLEDLYAQLALHAAGER